MGRPGAGVGAGLHKSPVHLVHPGDLEFAGGLVDPGQHRPADCHLQGIPVAGGVGDPGHVFGQVIHGPADGGLVVEGPAGHLEPGPVQGGFQLAADGVGRGGGQVLPAARRLLVPGIQQIQKGLVGVGIGRVQPRRLVEQVVLLQGLGSGLLEDLPQLGGALAGILGQDLQNFPVAQPDLLPPPQLPVGGGGEGAHLADPPGHVLQDVLLHLLPQLHHGGRDIFQVVRG